MMRLCNVGATEFAVTIGTLQPGTTEDLGDLIVIGAVSQRFPEVGTMSREQASIKHAIR
jgi:hypothetical protein